MPRPEVSGEVIQAVEELTDGDFNVPAHRVTFEDRVRVLAKQYQELLNAQEMRDDTRAGLR
jgi:hypothetical protein